MEASARVEIVAEMDRQEVEALYLEVRRLAQSRGIEIKNVRIERVIDEVIEKEQETGG